MALKQITISDTQSSAHWLADVKSVPETCPYCHRHISPKIFNGLLHKRNFQAEQAKIASVFLQCPNIMCNEVFIAEYFVIYMGHQNINIDYLTVVGGKSARKNFSETINSVSVRFIEIYNQANEAEFHSLEDISGIGYRKALEFLIKDYACRLFPDDDELIKVESLTSVIKGRIESQKIKDVAERAVWIGNDETHYTRKWADMDIVQLKKLIDLTVHWIEMEEITKQALIEMPRGKR